MVQKGQGNRNVSVRTNGPKGRGKPECIREDHVVQKGQGDRNVSVRTTWSKIVRGTGMFLRGQRGPKGPGEPECFCEEPTRAMSRCH